MRRVGRRHRRASAGAAPGTARRGRGPHSASSARDEREAVGVEARRGEADDRVAGAGPPIPSRQPVALDDADAEPGEVERVGAPSARVLGRLAADERAAGDRGSRRRPPPTSSRDVARVEPADSDVVEEERAARPRCTTTSSAHIATRSMPDRVVAAERAAAIAVFVPTPSVETTRTGSRSRAGIATRRPNPPRPPRTSGRRVDSTAPRISSTARSPAATSTPAVDVGAVGRSVTPSAPADQQRRPASSSMNLRLAASYGHGLRVVAVEAGEAEPLVRQVERGEHAADRQVAERVGADELADLLERVGRRR